MATLRETMASLPFTLMEVDGLSLWEATLGDTEILVASMNDGSVQITRQVDSLTPLMVSFSCFDGSIEALLKSWVEVKV